MTSNKNERARRIDWEPKESSFEILKGIFGRVEEFLLSQISLIRNLIKDERDQSKKEKLYHQLQYTIIMLNSIRTYKRFVVNIYTNIKYDRIYNSELRRALCETFKDITSHILFIEASLGSTIQGVIELDYTRLESPQARNPLQSGYYIDPTFYNKNPGVPVSPQDILNRGLRVNIYSQQIPTIESESRTFNGQVQVTLSGTLGDPQRIRFNLYDDEGYGGIRLGRDIASLRIDRRHDETEGLLELDLEFSRLRPFYNDREMKQLFRDAGAEQTHHWILPGIVPGQFNILTEEQTQAIFKEGLISSLSWGLEEGNDL